MKKRITVFITILLIVFTCVFSVINTQVVKVNFLLLKLNSPLVLVILFSIFIGALTMFLFSLSTNIQKNKQYKALQNSSKKEINTLKETNVNLNRRLQNSVGKQEAKVKQTSEK